MGMINCPTHGLMHLSMCCRQVADAFDANRLERAFVAIDGWSNHNLLCSSCYEQAVALINARAKETPDGQRFDFEFEEPLEPYCHSCLIDWYARTGQGDLSAAIAKARKEAGL